MSAVDWREIFVELKTAVSRSPTDRRHHFRRSDRCQNCLRCRSSDARPITVQLLPQLPAQPSPEQARDAHERVSRCFEFACIDVNEIVVCPACSFFPAHRSHQPSRLNLFATPLGFANLTYNSTSSSRAATARADSWQRCRSCVVNPPQSTVLQLVEAVLASPVPVQLPEREHLVVQVRHSTATRTADALARLGRPRRSPAPLRSSLYCNAISPCSARRISTTRR